MSLDSYVSLQKTPDTGAPLVFGFHGTGGDEHQFFGLIQNTLPDVGIVTPRGDVSENGANRFFKRTGEGVYDMDDLSARTETMADFVRAHKAKNNGAPIIGMGYSNGANILASVMFAYPDLFDAAAWMHPLVPWQLTPSPGLSGKPILLTAGQRDPICPLPSTKGLLRYLSDQGAEITQFIHEGGHEVRHSEIEYLQLFLKAQSIALSENRDL